MVTIIYAVCLFAVLVMNAYGQDINVDEHLEKFGYLDSIGKRSGNPYQRQLARTRALVDFQDYAHLPQTGELDEATKEKMAAPRCGMSDVSKSKNRASFYSKWDKDVITWKYIKPTNQLDSGKVRRAIKEAFNVWAKVIPLNFTEVSANQESDMQFGFGSRDHGDSYHFDGRGMVLAHAFFPKDGRLHFDDEEMWTYEDASQIKDGSYTDLLSVTIHEMGHALGLPHLKEQDAIMFAYYRHPELDNKGQIKPFVLSQYDIRAIQEAYGPREGLLHVPRLNPRPRNQLPQEEDPLALHALASKPPLQDQMEPRTSSTETMDGEKLTLNVTHQTPEPGSSSIADSPMARAL